MSYRITTDSTCDMPREFYTEHSIPCVGLGFQINGKEYREGSEDCMPIHDFYEALRGGAQSTTMQVNTYDFIDFVEPYLQAGEDVLHLCFSSGLSGTYESVERGAAELREKYPDRTILVVDSLAASMGEGLLLYYAQMHKEAGLTIQENATWLEDNNLHLCHWFTVDDLMHLHRGGRVSKASAIFGSLLGIKPVLHVDDEGHLILMSKSRGRQGAMEALAAKMKETVNDDVSDQMILISHGDCLEDAEKLKAIVQQVTGARHFMLHTIGTVIGSHSGPGTLALFFLGKHR